MLVSKPAPDFELEGYFNGSFGNYRLSSYRGKWVILLFHPLDFTFVCPTEVLNFSDGADELTSLNCRVFGISVDSKYVHKASYFWFSAGFPPISPFHWPGDVKRINS